MSQTRLSLAGEFDKPDLAAWRALIDQSLKGRSFTRALVSETVDGLPISPLYTRHDMPDGADPSGFPGQTPFIRGARIDGRGWQIRQKHTHPDPARANDMILRDLERGADAIVLAIDPCAEQGVAIGSLNDLECALDGFDLGIAPLYLEAGRFGPAAAALLMALWEGRGLAPDAVSGGFGIDPLGALASSGRLLSSLDNALREAGEIAAQCHDRHPQITALQVSTRAVHDAGATEAQELALALATGLSYLRACEGAGLAPDIAAKQISFTLMADADVFLTMAKFRAMRLLWGQVMAACGVRDGGMKLCAATAPRMLSRRDAYVNILRTTAAAFAAGVGGAEAITVSPFTDAIGIADRFARRIARNIQVILQEESGTGRVMDPAGGSYMVENLTRSLAEKAWDMFQDMEAKGGMAQILLSGEVADMLAQSRAARDLRLATRRDALTGVSEFPDLHEKPVAVEQVDRAALLVRTGGTIDGLRADGDAAAMPPLPVHRLAEPYERLRDMADSYPERPRIFLATLGSMADFTARATWVSNAYATGGFDAITGEGGTDPTAIAAAFAKSGAVDAVICSPNAQYETYAIDLARALKDAGARHVTLAGRPGEDEEAQRKAGIDGYLYAGCNILTALRDAHSRFAAVKGDNR